MSTWNIYHKDGSKLTDVNGEQITVHGLEYSDSWMGECFVTINFKHEVPINFQIGDYIVYRGERFELNYEPGKDKQARPDTYGEGFVYDSVKFNALQDELSRAEFLDVVLNDNELHYTTLPKFPFYVQTLDDLLDRIQANLDDQIGTGLWKIYSRSKERSVQRGCLVSDWQSMYGEGTNDNVIESMSITVDSQTCWQALALVNEKWDINFIVRGRNIYVGTTGIQANHIFKYGLGNGLYEIVQNADSEQSVVTRLRAYGSEKNLPSHYYADLGVKYVANITKVVTATTYVDLNIDIDYVETYFKNKRKYSVSQEQSFGWVLQVTFDFQTIITGYVTQAYDSKKCRFYSELKGTQTDTGDEVSKEKLDAFIAQVNAGNTKMYITSGLNKKKVPSSMKEYAENLPNNMSINRLMLPGFPHVSLSDFYDSLTEQEKKYVNPTGKQHRFSTDPHRPYIDSINIDQIGLRSASQFFDTDDKTNGVVEIYPTIEEMEIGGVRVDEIGEGVAPDDDGRFGDNETVKNVDIYLKKAIDFDINDLKDDDFSISMKDGMCGGRTFKVASSAKIDGRWRLTIERVKDDALELWFPYKDYPIKKGDHFVLTGITLPDSYVNAASLKLLKYAIALLDKNDYTRYVFQPKVDEIFMARQHDQAEADDTGVIKSLHDTLKAGDLMNFNDTDLNIEGIISIDQLTIKEEDGKIPTYDITLREDKEVGTIQKIQQQISSLQSGNGGTGGTGAGLTTTQVKGQIATEGSKHFISKITDDTAKGTVTWEKVQKFLQGVKVGANGDWTLDELDNTHLTTDYLQVRMKAIFETLEILHTDTLGGELFITPVGSNRILKVEEVNITYDGVSQKAYRCYFLGEQDGSKVENKWKVGDQARSKSFNLTQGKYHNVGNHYYWRLVIGVSTETVEIDGKKYHYVDLSDIDKDAASDEPMVDDILNQCGNRTDNARQSCLVFSAVDTYSPNVTLYHGVNGYTFNNKEYVDYGVNHSTNKAFFHVYGDMYFGDRPTSANNYEGDSYVKFDGETKKVTIKGDLDIKSTYDGKTLDKYIADKSLDKDAVETIIKKSQTIIDLQNQIDGAIETWFYDGVPTLKNAPAISWKTDKDKETHLGDLYYDNKTGKAYRFAKDGSTYEWIIITDTELTKALKDSSQALKDAAAADKKANGAQATANTKRRIFGSQPVPPYDVNDMWVNATYPSDGSTYKNEILKCSTSKAEGEEFDIADWKLASKYTDDTKAEEAKKAAEKAQAEIKNTQTNLIALGTTVSNNKKAFDVFTSDGYLDSSEIAAIAQDSKRLEDDYNAAIESYNNVIGSKFLLDKDGNETTYKTDLVSAKATLDSAKGELITYLSDIVSRYNASDSNGKATIKAAAAQKYTNFTNAYKVFYDKLGVANSYITSNLFDGLNTELITNMAGLEYIKAALVDGDTVVKGGLILSTLIALRNDKGNVTAGINGADTKENGIALWLGGKAIDKQASTTTEEEKKIAAKSLLRFDGTGYFANGNLWWDADGTLHADPTSFIINKNNVGVQLALFAPVWKSGTTDTTKLANVLSIDPQKPFTHLDVSGNVTTEGSLKIGGIYLSYDSANNALRLSKDAAGKEAANFYALGGITAYGAGASTTGGGGGLNGSVKSYSNALKLTSESLSEIASAYSIKALDSRISSLEGGSATAISVSGSGNAVTSVTKNGTTISVVKGSTFLTNHQSLDGYVNAISVSGSGNAITSVSKSGKGITFTKGATFLTSHQSLANYYTKSSVDSLLSGKSATSHTHSVKINGVTKTIAATGGTAVDLGTYLTSHQSLADYAKKSEIPTKVSQLTNDTGYITSSGSCAYATNADKVDGVHVTWAGELTSTNHLVAWEADGSALRDIKPANVSVGNSDKLDGIHANGLLTALSNSDKGISITVGGTTKSVSNISVNYASSAGNADTVDGEHASAFTRIVGRHAIYTSGTAPYNYIHLFRIACSSGYSTIDCEIDFRTRHHSAKIEIRISTAEHPYNNGGSSISIIKKVVSGRTCDFWFLPTVQSSNYNYYDVYYKSGAWNSGSYGIISKGSNGTLVFEHKGTNLTSLPDKVTPVSNNVATSATKLQTPRTIWGQSFDGTGNVDGTLSEVGNIHFKVDNSYDIGSNDAASRYIYTHWLGARSGRKLELGANNSGFGQGLCLDTNLNVGIGTNSPAYKLHVVGDIYSTASIRTIFKDKAIILSDSDNPAWISALAGQIIFDTGKAIRFGETAWDWNQWAGLKYTHSNKTIYLGIADGSVFEANSAQRNGTLKFPGITTITPDSGVRIGGSGGNLYLGNANNSGWVCVQDMCSQVSSSYWSINQTGSATFKTLTVNDVISCDSISVSKNAVIAGNLSVNGLINNKGILPTNYEVNNKGMGCYVSADALCSGITAITDSIPVTNVDIHYSNDNGTNWTRYEMSDNNKFKLYANVPEHYSINLGNNVITGNNDAEKLAQVKKNELMFSFEIPNSCYSQVYFACVDMGQGVGVTCTVEYLNSKGVIVNTYIKYMTGWNQFNYINLSRGNEGFPVGNDDRRYIRFRFKHDQNTTALRNASINKIRIFSFTKYSFPTDRFMGHTGHIYNFDYNMNTYFPNSILAKGGVTAYASSDIRLKQDLRKLDYLGIIKAMGGTYGFAWKKDNTRSIGWIAQHVLHNPHLKDIVETDEKGYYKINYWSPKLIATAFGAIEQVGDEVSRLKARVVFLESEVLRLSGDKEDCNKKRLDNKNINSLN